MSCGWIFADIIGDRRSTKVAKIMVVHWHLTFLRRGQVCFPMHLYGKTVENFKRPPLEPLGQCCSNFMWSLLGVSIAKMVAVHWPRWPPCPLLRPSTPTFDYLPWQITHSLYRYIFNLWQLRQRVDSDSVVRALEFYPDRPGSNPTISGKFFQLCFVPLLRLSCRKMGARPGSDFTTPKLLRVIINDDFLEKGGGGGVLRPSTPTFDYLPWQITHSL